MPESRFTSQQAVEVATACAAHGVAKKDIVDLLLLEDFRREYERRHAPDLESASEKALRGSGAAKTRKGK